MLGIDPILAACACALLYGTSTFLAGRSAARIGPGRALILFQSTGFFCAVALLLGTAVANGITGVSFTDLGLAALAGISFSIGWVFLGHGLAFGRTTVVAPVECLTSISFVALLEGIFFGWWSGGQLTGIAIAALAGMLVACAGKSTQGTATQSALLGIGAGIMFGCSYMSLGLVSEDGSITALAIMRFFAAVGSILWLYISASSETPVQPQAIAGRKPGAALAIAGGIADGLGTCAFIIATLNGLIGIAVAILSLYAAVTVVLGMLFLGERPYRQQIAGFAAAVTAVLILSR